MMRIMLFNQSDNLYEKGLAPFDSGYVVAPSPQMADIIRRKLAAHGSCLDVVTVSKFLRDELSLLKGEEVSENYRGKSELLLLLSTLWKKLEFPESHPERSYELFQRCFRLLTDLRSFSMSDDVLETALEHFDEKIAFGTLRMHQVLNQLDIYDEHRSYFQLSEQLRSGELPITYETERNIIFLGFDFLSASQVDLLKAYSIRDNVVVPVYQEVYESLSDWDWLSWLDGEDVEKIYLDEKRPLKTANISHFPKNYLGKAVKQTLLERAEANAQIVLGERHSSFEKIQQVNLKPAQFKSPVDILGDKIQWLMEQIPGKEPIPESEVRFILEELLQERIEKQDFRAIKALQLMSSILKDWRELSDDNEVVTAFDMKILREALSLDAPRVFQTALGKNQFKIDIKSLKELDDLRKGRLKIFCVASDFSSPKGTLVQYTEGVEKYLGSIGPLRRAELEFVALKEKMGDALDQDSVFLVEEGVLDRDQGWKSFFDTLDTRPAALELDFKKSAFYHRSQTPPKDDKKQVYSATKLQTYLDCPRKFLFKYALKLAPDYVFDDKLDALELGRLQHATIEKYVESFSHYVEEEHAALVSTLLNEAVKTKTLNRAAYADHKLETVSNTRRAITELLKLKNAPDVSVHFEQKIRQEGFRGSVDCVVETESDILLLDFKRGAGSLPSQTGFKSFEKIQLWFYANHWKLEGKNIGLGYVCLSDLESSIIYFSSDGVRDRFKGVFDSKPVSLEKNFEELFSKYHDFEERAINRLEGDEEFKAAPMRPKVCDYCELNKLCPRTDRRTQDARS